MKVKKKSLEKELFLKVLIQILVNCSLGSTSNNSKPPKCRSLRDLDPLAREENVSLKLI